MHQPHPHQNPGVQTAGKSLAEAAAAMILVHGRGASAAGILGLAPELGHPDFAYLAPQARDSTWYPFSFLAPLERNEPYLSSALRMIGELVAQVGRAGLPPEKIFLLGFSQGACLSGEFVARRPQRYGGLALLSGGLIGPLDQPVNHPGDLAGTPVFIGCSDVDMHIPVERVTETAGVLEGMGAEVTTRIYPGMAHTIIQDEIDFVRSMMASLTEV